MKYKKDTRWLQVLKGSTLKVLLALAETGDYMTAVELQEWTGITDKPVRNGLRDLEDRALAAHHGHTKGWKMTENGQQVTEIVSGAARKKLERAKRAQLIQMASKDNLPTSTGGAYDTAPQATPGTRENAAYGSQSERSSEKANGRKSAINQANLHTAGVDQNRSDLDQNEDNSIHYSDHVRSDQIRSDQTPRKQEEREPFPETGEQEAEDIRDPGEIEALKAYLSAIGIEGPGYRAIVGRDRLVDVVAWHWYTLGKNLRTPAGYIITCLEKGDKPGGAFLECAQAWLSLSKADLSAYYAASWRPYGEKEFWQEEGLTQRAIDIFKDVKRHGGLDLLDDFNRPILRSEFGARNGE